MISGNSLDRDRIQWFLSQTDGRRLRLSRPPHLSVWSIAFLYVRVCGFFPPGVLCECFLFPFFAFPYRFFNSWAAYPVREFPIGLHLSVSGRTTVSCSISFGDLGDRGGIQGGEGLQVYHLDLSRFVFFLHISLVSGCSCLWIFLVCGAGGSNSTFSLVLLHLLNLVL
jgi:hypothetical protein